VLNKNRVDLLVHALLSGEYTQARSALCVEGDSGERRYCCLGVACDVYSKATGEGKWDDAPSPGGNIRFWHNNYMRYSYAVLPEQVQAWYGLSGYQEDAMVQLNDTHKAEFPAIAEWLKGGGVEEVE
jgi:hypothetical protein